MTDQIILHIDMNSYFATVEQQANPLLRGKPIAVTGSPYTRTVVGASSIEAKKHGVRTGMSFYEAEKLCPQIIRVISDPDKYSEISKRFIRIMERYSPIVEVFSIDEAFLDITDTANRFGGPLSVARKLKGDIRAGCGEWVSCSVGISYNKLLAKLAGELRKPDGLTVITQENKSAIFAATPIERASGIGWGCTPRLNRMGVRTLGELAVVPVGVLVEEFGSYGYKLKEVGLGLDESPMRPYWKPEDLKSIGHQHTFAEDVSDSRVIEQMIFKLSELVAKRARQQEKLGREVHLWWRSGKVLRIDHHKHFESFGRRLSLPNHTQDGLTIFYAAQRMWQEAKFYEPTRLVGIVIRGLKDPLPQQLSLLLEPWTRDRVIAVVDEINEKYGSFVIQQGTLLGSMNIKRNMNGYGSDLKAGKTDLLTEG
jgi:DNA polymerase-4